MKFLFLLFFSTSFCFCQSSEYQSLLIPDQFKKNANSCVRDSKTTITFKDYDKMIVEQHHVVTLFNSKGKEDAGMILFYDDNIRVKNLEVRVYNALGKEIKKIKKRDFKDVSSSGGSTMYTDSRFYVLDYEPKEYPVTLVMNSETKNSNTAFVKPWQPISNHYQSVMKSEYKVIDEKGVGLRYAKSNFDFSDTVHFKKTQIGIQCSAENLTAIKNEDYSPSLKKFTPSLKVALSKFELEGVEGTATSWQELGKWQYENLINGRDEISDATIQTIKNLVAGMEDPIERAKKVYHYVQEKTRYISIQVGIGGWQPIEASEVDEFKYGDCKGLTNYTKALLKIAKVPANYAVVYAGSAKNDIDPDFPSMQGNHVILNLPQKNKQDIWLECTSQKTPFGFIGDFTDDRNVLLVKEDGGKIKKTVGYYEKDNYQKIDAELKLDATGDLMANFTVSSGGTQFDNKYFLQDRTHRKILNFYRKYYDHFKNVKVEDYEYHRNDEQVVFQEKLEIKAKNYAQKFGKRLMFIPNALNQTFSVPDQYDERFCPFTVSRGYFDKDKMVFTLPENWEVESIPQEINLKTKFGKYKAQFDQLNEDQISYKRSMLIKKGNYKKSEYSAFRDFLHEIKTKDQSKIILVKKPT